MADSKKQNKGLAADTPAEEKKPEKSAPKESPQQAEDKKADEKQSPADDAATKPNGTATPEQKQRDDKKPERPDSKKSPQQVEDEARKAYLDLQKKAQDLAVPPSVDRVVRQLQKVLARWKNVPSPLQKATDGMVNALDDAVSERKEVMAQKLEATRQLRTAEEANRASHQKAEAEAAAKAEADQAEKRRQAVKQKQRQDQKRIDELNSLNQKVGV